MLRNKFIQTPKLQVVGSNPTAPVTKKALQLNGCRAFLVHIENEHSVTNSKLYRQLFNLKMYKDEILLFINNTILIVLCIILLTILYIYYNIDFI
ncbi:MAG: hypothetical protein K0S47_4043 [Herbinix sp.]|nr:hypothetical protein [Herbinix sp.]